MGLKKTLFGSKVKQVDLNTPEQKAAIAALNQLAQTGSWGGITLGEGYGGSLGNYNLGEGVNQNISYLQNLLYSPQMQQAQQTYSDLANTKFNPDDPSSGYAAFQRQLAKAQKQAGSALERESAITGGRFGTQIIKSKGESQADFADQSASYLANLFQNARQSQLAGAQGLQSLLGTQSNLANQAMSAQDMQRQLQNQEAQAKYNEWERARKEKLLQIDLLSSESNRNANIGYTGGKQGFLTPLINSAMGAIGTTVGGAVTGGAKSFLGGLFGGGNKKGAMNVGQVKSMLPSYGSYVTL